MHNESISLRSGLSLRVLFVASAVATAIPVSAEEPSDAEKRAAAEAIFTQASQLMEAKKFDAACPKLEEVVKLQPNGIGARTTLGDCYEGQGKLASAHAAFGQAASMAELANQPDRAKLAQQKAAALAPRLTMLTVLVAPEVSELPDLSVMRGSMQVSRSLFNVPVAVDGGTYRIVAAADGYRPFTQSVTVPGEGGQHRIELQLEPQPSVRPPRGPIAPSDDGGARPTEAPGMHPVRVAGFVIGSIGVALAASGIGVGVAGLNENGRLVDAYKVAPKAEQSALTAQNKHAVAQARGGWVTSGIGGAAILTGIIMIIAAPSPIPAAPQAVMIDPWLGGLGLRGTW